METLVAVAAGGALGAIGRYLVMARVAAWLGDGFPYATLTVNVLGSYALGIVAGLAATAWALEPFWQTLVAIGFLGTFTTFSTFSLDVSLHLGRKERLVPLVYVLASVALSVGGFLLGVVTVGSLPR
ncbi:MAG: fluoride efflux transporter CrcB [Kiloniellales bacterium]|nr:fluoride efflux transporter CrcB [Kiloniellales bacterium]